MLRTITKEPEEVWKQHGHLAEHCIMLEDKVLLEVDECRDYHTTQWGTNLSGMRGYELVLEIYEALKRQSSNPTIAMIFRKLFDDIPLEQFLQLAPQPETLQHPDFLLFRVDLNGEKDGTSIVYDRTHDPTKKMRYVWDPMSQVFVPEEKPKFGLISTYNLSDIIPRYLKRSSSLSDIINEEEVAGELRKIQGRFTPVYL